MSYLEEIKVKISANAKPLNDALDKILKETHEIPVSFVFADVNTDLKNRLSEINNYFTANPLDDLQLKLSDKSLTSVKTDFEDFTKKLQENATGNSVQLGLELKANAFSTLTETVTDGIKDIRDSVLTANDLIIDLNANEQSLTQVKTLVTDTARSIYTELDGLALNPDNQIRLRFDKDSGGEALEDAKTAVTHLNEAVLDTATERLKFVVGVKKTPLTVLRPQLTAIVDGYVEQIKQASSRLMFEVGLRIKTADALKDAETGLKRIFEAQQIYADNNPIELRTVQDKTNPKKQEVSLDTFDQSFSSVFDENNFDSLEIQVKNRVKAINEDLQEYILRNPLEIGVFFDDVNSSLERGRLITAVTEIAGDFLLAVSRKFDVTVGVDEQSIEDAQKVLIDSMQVIQKNVKDFFDEDNLKIPLDAELNVTKEKIAELVSQAKILAKAVSDELKTKGLVSLTPTTNPQAETNTQQPLSVPVNIIIPDLSEERKSLQDQIDKFDLKGRVTLTLQNLAATDVERDVNALIESVSRGLEPIVIPSRVDTPSQSNIGGYTRSPSEQADLNSLIADLGRVSDLKQIDLSVGFGTDVLKTVEGELNKIIEQIGNLAKPVNLQILIEVLGVTEATTILNELKVLTDSFTGLKVDLGLDPKELAAALVKVKAIAAEVVKVNKANAAAARAESERVEKVGSSDKNKEVVTAAKETLKAIETVEKTVKATEVTIDAVVSKVAKIPKKAIQEVVAIVEEIEEDLSKLKLPSEFSSGAVTKSKSQEYLKNLSESLKNQTVTVPVSLVLPSEADVASSFKVLKKAAQDEAKLNSVLSKLNTAGKSVDLSGSIERAGEEFKEDLKEGSAIVSKDLTFSNDKWNTTIRNIGAAAHVAGKAAKALLDGSVIAVDAAGKVANTLAEGVSKATDEAAKRGEQLGHFAADLQDKAAVRAMDEAKAAVVQAEAAKVRSEAADNTAAAMTKNLQLEFDGQQKRSEMAIESAERVVQLQFTGEVERAEFALNAASDRMRLELANAREIERLDRIADNKSFEEALTASNARIKVETESMAKLEEKALDGEIKRNEILQNGAAQRVRDDVAAAEALNQIALTNDAERNKARDEYKAKIESDSLNQASTELLAVKKLAGELETLSKKTEATITQANIKLDADLEANRSEREHRQNIENIQTANRLMLEGEIIRQKLHVENSRLDITNNQLRLESEQRLANFKADSAREQIASVNKQAEDERQRVLAFNSSEKQKATKATVQNGKDRAIAAKTRAEAKVLLDKTQADLDANVRKLEQTLQLTFTEGLANIDDQAKKTDASIKQANKELSEQIRARKSAQANDQDIANARAKAEILMAAAVNTAAIEAKVRDQELAHAKQVAEITTGLEEHRADQLSKRTIAERQAASALMIAEKDADSRRQQADITAAEKVAQTQIESAERLRIEIKKSTDLLESAGDTLADKIKRANIELTASIEETKKLNDAKVEELRAKTAADILIKSEKAASDIKLNTAKETAKIQAESDAATDSLAKQQIAFDKAQAALEKANINEQKRMEEAHNSLITRENKLVEKQNEVLQKQIDAEIAREQKLIDNDAERQKIVVAKLIEEMNLRGIYERSAIALESQTKIDAIAKREHLERLRLDVAHQKLEASKRKLEQTLQLNTEIAHAKEQRRLDAASKALIERTENATKDDTRKVDAETARLAEKLKSDTAKGDEAARRGRIAAAKKAASELAMQEKRDLFDMDELRKDNDQKRFIRQAKATADLLAKALQDEAKLAGIRSENAQTLQLKEFAAKQKEIRLTLAAANAKRNADEQSAAKIEATKLLSAKQIQRVNNAIANDTAAAAQKLEDAATALSKVIQNGERLTQTKIDALKDNQATKDMILIDESIARQTKANEESAERIRRLAATNAEKIRIDSETATTNSIIALANAEEKRHLNSLASANTIAIKLAESEEKIAAIRTKSDTERIASNTKFLEDQRRLDEAHQEKQRRAVEKNQEDFLRQTIKNDNEGVQDLLKIGRMIEDNERAAEKFKLDYEGWLIQMLGKWNKYYNDIEDRQEKLTRDAMALEELRLKYEQAVADRVEKEVERQQKAIDDAYSRQLKQQKQYEEIALAQEKTLNEMKRGYAIDAKLADDLLKSKAVQSRAEAKENERIADRAEAKAKAIAKELEKTKLAEQVAENLESQKIKIKLEFDPRSTIIKDLKDLGENVKDKLEDAAFSIKKRYEDVSWNMQNATRDFARNLVQNAKDIHDAFKDKQVFSPSGVVSKNNGDETIEMLRRGKTEAEKLESGFKQISKVISQTAQPLKDQVQSLKETGSRIGENILKVRDFAKELVSSENIIRNWNKGLNAITFSTELDVTGLFKQINEETDKKHYIEFIGKFKEFSLGVFKGMGSRMAGAFNEGWMELGAELGQWVRNGVGLIGDSVKSYAEISKAAQTISASNKDGIKATAAEIEEFKKQSVKAAQDSTQTLESIAEFSTNLGRSGLNFKEVSATMGGIAIAADATGEEVGKLGQLVASQKGIYQLNTEELQKLSAAYAVAGTSASYGSTGFADYTATFQKYLKSNKQGIEGLKDAMKLQIIMAKVGSSASQAGTGLNNVLARLAAPTPKSQAAYEELNASLVAAGKNAIVFQDAAGNWSSQPELIADIGVAFNDLTKVMGEVPATGIFKKAFETQGLAAIKSVSRLSRIEIQKMFDQVNAAVGKGNGDYAANVKKIMDEGLSGAMRKFDSAKEGFQGTLGKGFENISNFSIRELAKFIEALSKDEIFAPLSAVSEQLIKKTETPIAKWRSKMLADSITGIASAVGQEVADIVNFWGNLILDPPEGVIEFRKNLISLGENINKFVRPPLKALAKELRGVGDEAAKSLADTSEYLMVQTNAPTSGRKGVGTQVSEGMSRATGASGQIIQDLERNFATEIARILNDPGIKQIMKDVTTLFNDLYSALVPVLDVITKITLSIASGFIIAVGRVYQPLIQILTVIGKLFGIGLKVIGLFVQAIIGGQNVEDAANSSNKTLDTTITILDELSNWLTELSKRLDDTAQFTRDMGLAWEQTVKDFENIPKGFGDMFANPFENGKDAYLTYGDTVKKDAPLVGAAITDSLTESQKKSKAIMEGFSGDTLRAYTGVGLQVEKENKKRNKLVLMSYEDLSIEMAKIGVKIALGFRSDWLKASASFSTINKRIAVGFQSDWSKASASFSTINKRITVGFQSDWNKASASFSLMTTSIKTAFTNFSTSTKIAGANTALAFRNDWERTKIYMNAWSVAIANTFTQLKAQVSSAAKQMTVAFRNDWENTKLYMLALGSAIGGIFGKIFNAIAAALAKVAVDFKNTVENIKGWFSQVGSTIKTSFVDAMDSLKSKVKEIKTEITGWLQPLREGVGMLNNAANKIPGVSQAKSLFSGGGLFGFAEGGVLPGYSKTDNVLAMLRSGEGILTPEAVKKVGGEKTINALNDGSIPRFAAGGVVGSTYKKTIDDIQLTTVLDAIKKVTKSFPKLQAVITELSKSLSEKGLKQSAEGIAKFSEAIAQLTQTQKTNIYGVAKKTIDNFSGATAGQKRSVLAEGSNTSAYKDFLGVKNAEDYFLASAVAITEGLASSVQSQIDTLAAIGNRVQTGTRGGLRDVLLEKNQFEAVTKFGLANIKSEAQLRAKLATMGYKPDAFDKFQEALLNTAALKEAIDFIKGSTDYRSSDSGATAKPLPGDPIRKSGDNYYIPGGTKDASVSAGEAALIYQKGQKIMASQIRQNVTYSESVTATLNTFFGGLTKLSGNTLQSIEDVIKQIDPAFQQIIRDLVSGKLKTVTAEVAQSIRNALGDVFIPGSKAGKATRKYKVVNPSGSEAYSLNQTEAHHDYQTNARGESVKDFSLVDKQTDRDDVDVPSAIAGKVIKAWFDAGGYGNSVIVKRVSDGAEVLMGHMQSLAVKTGDMVEAGQSLGIQGTTGQSTGVHVHMEAMQSIMKEYIDTIGSTGDFASPAIEVSSQKLINSLNAVAKGSQALGDAYENVSDITEDQDFKRAMRAIEDELNTIKLNKENFTENAQTVAAQKALDTNKKDLERLQAKNKLDMESFKLQQKAELKRAQTPNKEGKVDQAKVNDLIKKQTIDMQRKVEGQTDAVRKAQEQIDKDIARIKTMQGVEGFEDQEDKTKELELLKKRIREEQLSGQELADALEKVGIKADELGLAVDKAAADISEVEKIFTSQGIKLDQKTLKVLNAEYAAFQEKQATMLSKVDSQFLSFLSSKGLLNIGALGKNESYIKGGRKEDEPNFDPKYTRSLTGGLRSVSSDFHRGSSTVNLDKPIGAQPNTTQPSTTRKVTTIRLETTGNGDSVSLGQIKKLEDKLNSSELREELFRDFLDLMQNDLGFRMKLGLG